jgi:hypothetical protein
MNPEFANDNHHSYIIKESFWGQDVGANVGKLLIKKERETGIEPATSSLGRWASIESKEQSRTMASTISIQNAGVFTFQVRVQFKWAAIGLHLHDANPIT